MSAKAYDKKTAAFIGYLIQNISAIPDEIMDSWMNDPTATKNFLAGLNPPKAEVPAKQALLLSAVATTNLDAIVGKKTAECFTSYASRDSNFDNWLSKDQPGTPAGTVTACAVNQEWVFTEAARALPGVEQTEDMVLLGRSLIVNGYTTTLPQIEDIVERTKRGENTGLRVHGYGNFFFVETDDPENPVSVGSVSLADRAWRAILRRLGYDDRWRADFPLLVCNLGPLQL